MSDSAAGVEAQLELETEVETVVETQVFDPDHPIVRAHQWRLVQTMIALGSRDFDASPAAGAGPGEPASPVTYNDDDSFSLHGEPVDSEQPTSNTPFNVMNPLSVNSPYEVTEDAPVSHLGAGASAGACAYAGPGEPSSPKQVTTRTGRTINQGLLLQYLSLTRQKPQLEQVPGPDLDKEVDSLSEDLEIDEASQERSGCRIDPMD